MFTEALYVSTVTFEAGCTAFLDLCTRHIQSTDTFARLRCFGIGKLEPVFLSDVTIRAMKLHVSLRKYSDTTWEKTLHHCFKISLMSTDVHAVQHLLRLIELLRVCDHQILISSESDVWYELLSFLYICLCTFIVMAQRYVNKKGALEWNKILHSKTLRIFCLLSFVYIYIFICSYSQNKWTVVIPSLKTYIGNALYMSVSFLQIYQIFFDMSISYGLEMMHYFCNGMMAMWEQWYDYNFVLNVVTITLS